MIDEDVVRTARAEVAMRLASEAGPNGNGTADISTEADRVRRARSFASEFFSRHARESLRMGRHPLTTDEEEDHVREVLNSLFGLAGFQRYWENPELEEVVANGCDEVFVRRAGSDDWEPVDPRGR